MSYKKKIIITAASLLFFITAGAEAQEVNCSDYYRFQSVQANVDPDKSEYIPQEDVIFKGILENQNDYPIVDGYLFVRMTRKNLSYVREGNFIIDEFMPLKEMALDAREKKEINFSWRIPKNSISGDYEADFFFSAGKKFNLGGLPYTNAVVMGMANFKVISRNTAIFEMDRSATTVNGEPYNHNGNLPIIRKGESAAIVQPIKNSSTAEDQVDIRYDLYFWDSLDETARVDSRKELVNVPSGQTRDLTYTIPEMKEPVYLLKITASSRIQKSIVNIRLASNQDHPILNFPAITKFPLVKGDNETIFSCFSNSSNQDSSGNKVLVTLTDKNDKEIGRMEYQGNIAGTMGAAKNDFKAKSTYDYLKLTATMTDKDNNIIDKYETIYDCEKINPGKCLVDAMNKKQKKDMSILLVEILILIVLVGFVIFLRKKWMDRNIYIFLFVLVSSFLLFGGRGAEASLVVADSHPNTSIGYDVSGSIDYTDGVSMPVGICYNSNQCMTFNIAANMQYEQRAYMEADSPLSVGQVISLDPARTFTRVTYTDTSGSAYAAVCDDIDDLATCTTITWLSDHTYNGTLPGSDPATFNLNFDSAVVISKTNPYLTSSNPSAIQCSGSTCIAVGVGSAMITAVTPEVPYYELYRVYGTGVVGGIPKGYDTIYSAPQNIFNVSSAGVGVDVIAGSTEPVLAISKSGIGTGIVTSSPAGISCGSTCSANFSGTVTLTAIADGGSEFVSWGGCDAVNGNVCTVNVSSSRIITADFSLLPPNSPPSIPTITGPTQGEPDIIYTFTALSTDPTGEMIQYGFDWNNDWIVDEWKPGLLSYVDSGVSQDASISWNAEGANSFQAKACDINGNCSSWSSYSVAIGIEGKCGSNDGDYEATDTDWDIDGSFCSIGNFDFESFELVKTFSDATEAYDVFVSGNWAYVADGDSGLRIIDISDPLKPQLVKTVATGGEARKLFVSGNYAYVAAYTADLKIINISDPSNAYVQKTYTTTGTVEDVFVSGNFAYLANYSYGLRVVNLTNIAPTAPALTLEWSVAAAEPWSVYVYGNYVYLAGYDNGIHVIDAATRTKVRTIYTGGIVVDVYVYDGRLYTADDNLKIYGLTDPSDPSLEKEVTVGNFPIQVYASGNYAYAADYNGITVLDISDFGDIKTVGSYTFTYDSGWGVYPYGDYVYLAAGWDYLNIFKMSSPDFPDPCDNLEWTCSSTGSIPDTSCEAYRRCSSDYRCLTESDCTGLGLCGLQTLCLHVDGSPPPFPPLENCDPSCSEVTCPSCDVPTAPVVPRGRSWKETHPEAN